MEYRIRLVCFSSVLILAVAITGSVVTASALASRAYTKRMEQIHQSQREITVKGKATARIVSDWGVWTVWAQSSGATLQEGYATLEETNAAVAAYLLDQGFTQREIASGPVKTETYYQRDEDGNKTREIEGYSLSRRYTIGSKRLQQMNDAASGITALIAKGMEVTSSPPEFTVSTLGNIKIQLLADAAADARNRASRVVGGSGGQLTELKSVRQGVVQITQPDSTRVSSYGIYDTTTINKDASVVVTVTFGIEDAKD
jgi:hypothetical protein